MALPTLDTFIEDSLPLVSASHLHGHVVHPLTVTLLTVLSYYTLLNLAALMSII